MNKQEKLDQLIRKNKLILDAIYFFETGRTQKSKKIISQEIVKLLENVPEGTTSLQIDNPDRVSQKTKKNLWKAGFGVYITIDPNSLCSKRTISNISPSKITQFKILSSIQTLKIKNYTKEKKEKLNLQQVVDLIAQTPYEKNFCELPLDKKVSKKTKEALWIAGFAFGSKVDTETFQTKYFIQW